MKLFLKILKYTLYVLGVLAIFGFLYFFVSGIINSLFADDIITAQNRIDSAYSFLWMILCGLIAIGTLFPTMAIKEEIFFDDFIKKIVGLFKKEKKQ
ncbi:MAG: hypothetical protein ACI311_07455 [Bacilli bacterium]